MSNAKKHQGSCHCGAVKFEVEVDATQGGRCNCSICAKLNSIGAIAKPDALTITHGESELSSYAWGHKISTRYFCKHCGVYLFSRGHLAELGGDYVGVYLTALDDIDPGSIDLIHWDGRHDNWEAGPSKTPYPIRA
jgi:hypothetical protein